MTQSYLGSNPSSAPAKPYSRTSAKDEITDDLNVFLINSGHFCVFKYPLSKGAGVKVESSQHGFPSNSLFDHWQITNSGCVLIYPAVKLG